MKSEKWLKTSYFSANEQLVPSVSNRCGEDKYVATVFQFQFFAEFSNGDGEVAHRDIGSVDTRKNRLQFVFVHRSCLFDDKTAAWEVWNIRIGNKQVTIAIELSYPKPLFQQYEASCFHDGGVWLE